MHIHPPQLAGVLIAAVTAGAFAVPASAAPRTLTTKGAISSLAMQDSRVALTAERTDALCDRAMAWNPLAGGVVIVSDTTASVTCPDERPNGGIGTVSLAGKRVAWLTTFGGNTEQTTSLQQAAVASPGKETTVARATSNPETGTGKFLAGLVGRNSLTAFNSWTGDLAAPTAAHLRRVTETGSASILNGPNALVAGATDGATVVVPNVDGSVALVSPTGTIELTPSAAVRSVAINAGRVAVQEVGSTVELFWVASGAPVGSLTLQPGSAPGIDLYRGVVVYRTFRDVRAQAVASGTDRRLASAPRAIVGAEIESPGVVYGYNTIVAGQFSGEVRRVPLAAVLSAVG